MRQTRAEADAVQSRERERAGELAELSFATRSHTVAALYDLEAGPAYSQCLNRSSSQRKFAVSQGDSLLGTRDSDNQGSLPDP